MLQKGVYPYENVDDLKKMNNCTHKNFKSSIKSRISIAKSA